jgi:hypothetical protein
MWPAGLLLPSQSVTLFALEDSGLSPETVAAWMLLFFVKKSDTKYQPYVRQEVFIYLFLQSWGLNPWLCECWAMLCF